MPSIKDPVRPFLWAHGHSLRMCRYGHLVSAVQNWSGCVLTVCEQPLGSRKKPAVVYPDPNDLPDKLRLCPSCIDLAPDDA